MKTIFAIDDESGFLIILKTYLENNGFKVEPFLSSIDFLNGLKDKRPDLVISDLYLESPTSGLDLCEKVKSIDKTIPFVLLSAMDSKFLDLEGRKCTADLVFRKPYENKKLLLAIKGLINGDREAF